MKKIIFYLIAITLLISGCENSKQSKKSGLLKYRVEELELTIGIPENLLVMTRNSELSPEEFLAKYNFEKEERAEQFQKDDIYLKAWSHDFGIQVEIKMQESEYQDSNQYGDKFLLAQLNARKFEFVENSYDYLNADIYQHKQAKFVWRYELGAKPYYGHISGVRYETYYNNQHIEITIYDSRTNQELDDKTKALMQEIIDSIVFDKPPHLDIVGADPTEAYKYVDPISHSVFTIPPDWFLEVIVDDEYGKIVQFSNSENANLYIACHDVYEEWGGKKKIKTGRQSLNNRMFSLKDMADYLEVGVDEITKVTYGGNEYFCNWTFEGYFYDQNNMVKLVRAENGYFYAILIDTGSGDLKIPDELIEMLNSIEYR